MSSVDNADTVDCFLSSLSFDQSGHCSSMAKAIKSMSLSSSACSGSGIGLASDIIYFIDEVYCSSGMKDTFAASSSRLLLNSDLESFVLCNISDSCFLSSNKAYSGENNCISDVDNISFSTEFFQKKVNRTFESMTSFIYSSLFFFSSFNLSSREVRCALMAQSVNDCSSRSLSSISSFQARCLARCSMAFLTNPDQFTSENFFMSFLVSSGTETVMDDMSEFPPDFVKKQDAVKIFKSFGLLYLLNILARLLSSVIFY